MSSEFIGALSSLNYNGPKPLSSIHIYISKEKGPHMRTLHPYTLIRIYEYTNIQLDHPLGVMHQFPVVYQMQSVDLT